MKGEILRELRRERKLTQLELANYLGVTRSLIGMVETNRQDGGIKFARKVAEYFNVSMDYLEGLTDNKHEILVEKEMLINDFLRFLIDNKVITDEDNIDDNTKEIILNMVKNEIKKIKNEKK